MPKFLAQDLPLFKVRVKLCSFLAFVFFALSFFTWEFLDLLTAYSNAKAFSLSFVILAGCMRIYMLAWIYWKYFVLFFYFGNVFGNGSIEEVFIFLISVSLKLFWNMIMFKRLQWYHYTCLSLGDLYKPEFLKLGWAST